MVALPFLSRPRSRRLTTLLAVVCVSTGVIAIGRASNGEPASPQAAPRGVSQSPSAPTSPSPSSTAPVATSPTATPSPSKVSRAKASRPRSKVLSASCTGSVRNFSFTAAGGTVTHSDSPPPRYLQIKKASLVRDSKGVTVSYTLSGTPPHPGSNIPLATYWTWLGDGLGDVNEPSVSVEYFKSRWRVEIDGPVDVLGGTANVRPVINGHTVSVRLPLHVAVSTGWELDLSKFTHVGWSTEGRDPSDYGTWMDGCPISGAEAGNPGAWEIALR